MNKNAVFTISSKNYFAQGISLLDSIFMQHKNDLDYYYLIVDENINEIEDYNLKFNLVLAKNIGIPDFYSLAFKYNVIEFNTAVKPFFFDYLFKDYEKVVYFDPDIFVYKSLDLIFKILDSNDILLTPHIINPDFRINLIEDGEYPFLQTGIFNLGFLGVKKSGESLKFVDWFKERTFNACFIDNKMGLFVDQKWINFVPCLFNSYFILKDKYYNVAYWNISERNFKESEINEIVFYHFSSFDIKDNDTITKLNSKFFNLSNFPLLADKVKLYRQILRSNGYLEYRNIDYSYSKFNNGSLITSYHRKIYKMKPIKEPFNVSKTSVFYLHGYILFTIKQIVKNVINLLSKCRK
ncbi:MAG TPA: hypothetical protein DCQ26_10050 [Marinilabiliales bacterium]|nr:MAG: hypothetical protein A2W95_14915 [Bacteroidetes bacterium GWA2_40_14]OFX57569.1 MAG: hypothetical protein A2W84_04185 [Bacteroidetes bacterium GWC2_40_13]OFX73240.1 MAG: hypothetical protein A2W96_07210 [Bacteroidetes bacterium GWD2_40_43]OFX92095.1 MAG: hypothetical protein A2W97_08500 [Bacteroidetes bacterium GWE2_40_63]OFY16719.1 MAG: hypothetical protein A2W88_16175 [Bacteroidetes bacterium GWF2_40_13]OFZ30615.1 MAG: hypothetical protein A2437_02860 [Bacteroidetes bacterium RIFOXYC